MARTGEGGLKTGTAPRAGAWWQGTVGVVLAMAGVNAIWGAAFPLMKPALETIPPFTFALLRFGLALAVLLPLAGGPALALLRGADGRRVIVMGQLGFGVAQLSQTAALELTSASDIALIATTTPLWIAALAVGWLGERLTARQWLGYALAIAGLVLVLGPSDAVAVEPAARLAGGALFMVCCLAWAGYNVMGKAVLNRHDPLTVTTAAALAGSLNLIPAAGYEVWSGRTVTLTPVGVAAIIYTGLLVTVLGFLVLFWAYRRASTARVAITMYLQPLVGVVLAWQLLGEPLGAIFLLGAALVLAGVAVVTMR